MSKGGNSEMSKRKAYDYYGVEISMWNKSNTVTYIDCECGMLATLDYRTHGQFHCSHCGKCFKKHRGTYVEIKKEGED